MAKSSQEAYFVDSRSLHLGSGISITRCVCVSEFKCGFRALGQLTEEPSSLDEIEGSFNFLRDGHCRRTSFRVWMNSPACILYRYTPLASSDTAPALASVNEMSREQPEVLPMPADEGVRFDEPAGVPPGLGEVSEETQKEPVGGPDLQLW